jgi:hypothetical protein
LRLFFALVVTGMLVVSASARADSGLKPGESPTTGKAAAKAGDRSAIATVSRRHRRHRHHKKRRPAPTPVAPTPVAPTTYHLTYEAALAAITDEIHSIANQHLANTGKPTWYSVDADSCHWGVNNSAETYLECAAYLTIYDPIHCQATGFTYSYRKYFIVARLLDPSSPYVTINSVDINAADICYA